MTALLPTDADTFREDAVVTELFGDAALRGFHALLARWVVEVQS